MVAFPFGTAVHNIREFEYARTVLILFLFFSTKYRLHILIENLWRLLNAMRKNFFIWIGSLPIDTYAMK